MPPTPVQLAYDHLAAGRIDQARGALTRYLQRAPRDPEACAAMSLVLLRAGEHDRAAYYAGIAAERLPDDPRAQHNLGNILVSAARFQEALAPLNRARALAPAEPQTIIALGNAYSGMNMFASAAAVLREGLRFAPEHPRLLNNLGHALHQCGRIEDGLPLIRRACELEPANLTFADGLAATVVYAPGLSGTEVRQAAEQYGRLVEGARGPLPPRPPRHDGDRPGAVRIGLLSQDLRAHAVAHFAEPIMQHLDRDRFTVIAYSAVVKEDDVSARLRSHCDRWRNIAAAAPEQAARIIHQDAVDILIDLAGHTGGNRLPVLALRPARVQITGIGFPSTTGMSRIDWRLTDSLGDPAGFADFATESLLRVDQCCQCYRPPENPPPVLPRPDRGGPADGVTFVAFSSLLKFNRRLAQLWARVLAATPGSRLVLRHFGLKEESIRRDVVQRIVAAAPPPGLDPGRILAEPPVASAGDHLRRYEEADIALDTAPYTGTTTICEALLMGVPVISMAGSTPAGRVALSVLTAAGLGEFCADDEDGYVRMAAALAADPPRRQALRRELRQRLLGSMLCDGPGYGRRLGEALLRAAADTPGPRATSPR